MATIRRCLDLFFVVFFILHAFITVLFDSQVIFPARFYPAMLPELLNRYATTYGDYFVRERPHFFKGLVFAEIFFQLPLVFINAYGFYHGRKWVKTTGLIYGVHTATTLIPILVDLFYSNSMSKFNLMMIYIPYFLIPVVLTIHVLTLQSTRRGSSSKAKKRI